MLESTRLGIIHRSRLFREVAVSLLAGKHEFEVVELNHENEELRVFLEQEELDVIILDLSLPQVTELAGYVAEHHPDLRVVALVSEDCHDKWLECVAAGCHAWVHEESPLEDLLTAINDTLSGRMFCSPTLMQTVLSLIKDIARDAQGSGQVAPGRLTQRELEILGLISQHLSNKEIARRLSVSLFTVKNHVHNILDKLSVGSRYEAVQYAKCNHWLR